MKELLLKYRRWVEFFYTERRILSEGGIVRGEIVWGILARRYRLVEKLELKLGQ